MAHVCTAQHDSFYRKHPPRISLLQYPCCSWLPVVILPLLHSECASRGGSNRHGDTQESWNAKRTPWPQQNMKKCLELMISTTLKATALLLTLCVVTSHGEIEFKMKPQNNPNTPSPTLSHYLCGLTLLLPNILPHSPFKNNKHSHSHLSIWSHVSLMGSTFLLVQYPRTTNWTISVGTLFELLSYRFFIWETPRLL